MPRSFSNDDYQVSKFLNNVLMQEQQVLLSRENLFSNNFFNGNFAQQIIIPNASVLTEQKWQPGGSGYFVSKTAYAHTIVPAEGVTINGSSSAIVISDTPFANQIALTRIGQNEWMAIKTLSSGGIASEFSGALAVMTGTYSLPTSLNGTDVPWQSVSLPGAYDTNGFWNISEPEFLTIPEDFGSGFLKLNVSFLFETSFDAFVSMRFKKNGNSANCAGGSITKAWGRSGTAGAATDTVGYSVTSAPIPYIGGDYFNLSAAQNSGSAKNVLSGVSHTFFSLEIMSRA